MAMTKQAAKCLVHNSEQKRTAFVISLMFNDSQVYWLGVKALIQEMYD